MTIETLFEKFDGLVDTPNAVPRMRRFILDLAVRGKLVAQNAEDESAIELLKRIQAERVRLVETGEIKKQERLPPVTDNVIPFVLPDGWAASQLGDITVCLDYMREPINGTERDARIAGKPKSELFPYYGATQQQGWIDDYIFDSELVLLGEDGVPFFDDLRPKAYLISGKTWVNNHAHVFRGILVSNPYVMHWLNTFDYAGRVAGSTRSKLNQAKAVDIPIALPPPAEQKRIVAKVDELMALCDRLEEQQQERETRHAALARASLARFGEAPTVGNLEFIFHKSYAIAPAELRKSILTLAVQGKLVSQDPNDEPAEVILRSTVKLFERLVAAKKLSTPKPLPRIEESDCPFTLPSGWAWCRFGQIARISSGDGLTANDMNGGPIPVYGGNGVNGRHDSHNVTKPTLVIGRVGFYCGSVHVTPEKAWVTDNAFTTTFDEEQIDIGFLSWLLKATDLRERDNATAQPVISGSKIYPIILALPPLAEQRRIVAKVDELMALVDALEIQLATARTTATNLLAAIVSELTNAKKSPEPTQTTPSSAATTSSIAKRSVTMISGSSCELANAE